VHVIGRINLTVLRLAGFEPLTDEVVITDPQIQHIKENHPNVYERYKGYLSHILAEPDIIVEANKPNSAVLLKSFFEDETHFQLILRLKIEDDPDESKNSVITFWKIESKRYRRILRTKKILYKQV